MTEQLAPIRYADAHSHGVTPAQLRGPDWEQPAHSLYTPPGFAGSLTNRCQAVRLVLAQDAVFTHVTAAQLRGWWLPSTVTSAPLIACTDARRAHHNRRGVYVRRCRTAEAHRSTVDGIPVTTAERTLAELAEDFSLLDLVVAMDSALHFGHCSPRSLDSGSTPGRPGNKRYCAAIALADGRSESPWESRLRLLHEWSGVPVEPQYLVAETETSQFVAVGDLRIVGTRLLAEYDGADHRTSAQQLRDLSREKELARTGWTRYGYVAADLVRQPHRIIADAFDALGHRYTAASLQRVLRRWHRESARSSLSPGGAAALDLRMQRFERQKSPRKTHLPH